MAVTRSVTLSRVKLGWAGSRRTFPGKNLQGVDKYLLRLLADEAHDRFPDNVQEQAARSAVLAFS
jgi:hypothetical protein